MAKQSLYGKTQNEKGSDNLPALPTGSGIATVKPPEQEAFGPYVTFVHKDKGKWSDLVQQVPGLADGDAVLIGDGDPRKIAPLTFFLLDAFQFWAVLGGQDADYKPMKTWLKKPEVDSWNSKRINETLTFATMLLDRDTLIPASMRLSSGMCQGGYSSIRAVSEAGSPEWAKLSSEHAATMPIPQPNLRFKTELSWRPKKSRGGYLYFVSSGRIIPTTTGDAMLFKSAGANQQTSELVNVMLQSFADYKSEMESLA